MRQSVKKKVLQIESEIYNWSNSPAPVVIEWWPLTNIRHTRMTLMCATASLSNNIGSMPVSVFSYSVRYMIGFRLVEMAIPTNLKPTIYPNLYENTDPGECAWATCTQSRHCEKGGQVRCVRGRDHHNSKPPEPVDKSAREAARRYICSLSRERATNS